MSLTPTQLSELQTIVETLRTEFPSSDDDLWQAAIRIQKGGLGPVTGTGGQPAFDAAVADIVEEAEQISAYQGKQGGLGQSFDVATFNVVPIEGELPAGSVGDVIYLDVAPNTYLATDVVSLTPAGPNSVILSEIGTQVARTVSAANGGLEVNNLNTGAGFERVLTTADMGAGLTIEDEGVPLAGAASTLDFVGAGVTASGAGATKTITIPGGGTVAGADTQVQFNDAGAFGASANLTWDDNTLDVTNTTSAAPAFQINVGNNPSVAMQIDTTLSTQYTVLRMNDQTGGNFFQFIHDYGLSTPNHEFILNSSAFGDIIEIENEGNVYIGGTESTAILKVQVTQNNGEILIDNGATLFIEETASAQPDNAGQGQWWVLTATPNRPAFTDDTGIDLNLDTSLYDAAHVNARIVAQTGGDLYQFGDANADPTVPDAVNIEYQFRSDNNNEYGGIGYNAGTALRMFNRAHGGLIQLNGEDATGSARVMVQCNPDQEVLLRDDNADVMSTLPSGIAIFGGGTTGVTNTRIEFLDALPGGTRNFVIGALGSNQSNILDELLNRPLRIAGTSGSGIENFMIGTPNGDTLLQGNTGVRVQTASGVIDFRTPSIRFSMNSAGQLNLLGNGTQSGVINFTEGTSAFSSVAGEGQLWVRNDTPNVLVFTDDAGTDFDLNTAGGIGGSITDNQIAVGAATADDIEGDANFTWDATTLRMNGIMRFVERAASLGDVAGESQLWVRNTSDGELVLTDDQGLDQNLSSSLYFNGAVKASGQLVGLDITGNLYVNISGQSIYLGEKASANIDQAGDGQLWVRSDTPNNLMFTDDGGNDFLVAGTGAGADISAGSNLISGTSFVAVANVSPEINTSYMVLASLEVTAPAADDMLIQFTIDTNARFYGTLTNTEDDSSQIIEGQTAEVVTNNVLVPTSGSATPAGTYVTIVGRLIMGATTGTMSLRCAKNADTGADGFAIRSAVKLIPLDPQ